MDSPSSCSSINARVTDDELRLVLAKLEGDKEKEAFGLVCKRWLKLQSTERKKLAARAGPHMLQRMVARFSQLVELDLSQSASRSFYPGVSDSDLIIVGGFKDLRILNLQNCPGITNNGLRSIAYCLPGLQSLNVSFCKKLTDEGLTVVAERCRDLHLLHVAGCRLVGDGTLRALSKNCPTLAELSLHGCLKVTNDGISFLVIGCRQITYLDISKCSNLGDSSVSSVPKSCAALKTLKMLDCYRIGDESILSLSSFCKRIETLIIGGCRSISDESIKTLAVAFNETLKNLRMDWCLNVSDSSVSRILVECKNLECLDIGCCENVTDAAFGCLKAIETNLKLRFLRASNCPKITVNGIAMLLDKCYGLEYLDVRSCTNVTESDCEEAGLQFPKCCKVNYTGSLLDPGVICLE